MGEESSDSGVVCLVGVQDGWAPWALEVELGIFGKGFCSGFAVGVDVFPCLRGAVNEDLRAGSDDVSVLVVEFFELIVILSCCCPVQIWKVGYMLRVWGLGISIVG